MRDRTGILLIMAGALLIFWNLCSPFGGIAADGQEACKKGIVCSQEDETGQKLYESLAAGGKDAMKPAGCLQLVGSSSMERYAGALAEGFMERYTGVDVILQFTGSSAGIASVTDGSADIGMSSRYLTEEEKAAGAVENIVGFDCFAICANPANGITGLTREQLSRLYTGEIAVWSELGGSELPVVLIGREAGSGTRRAFEEFLGIADRCTYANELDSTGAVMARVAVTPGAVGYVSLEAADRMCRRTEPDDRSADGMAESGSGDSVAEDRSADGMAESRVETALTVLSLDGAEPSMTNIRSGSYPLYRPFIMVTRGEAENGNELVRAWFAYVGSEEGERIAEEMRVAAKP